MLDIGWQELFIIALVALVVVGPREMPRLVRSVVGLVRRARQMASSFQDSVESLARETELSEFKKSLERTGLDAVKPYNPDKLLETQEVEQSVRAALHRAAEDKEEADKKEASNDSIQEDTKNENINDLKADDPQPREASPNREQHAEPKTPERTEPTPKTSPEMSSETSPETSPETQAGSMGKIETTLNTKEDKAQDKTPPPRVAPARHGVTSFEASLEALGVRSRAAPRRTQD